MVGRRGVSGGLVAAGLAALLGSADAGPVLAQTADQPIIVNYGALAPAREGDNDHRQVFYFSVPETVAGPLYIRIFDPGASGAHDLIYGSPGETETRFAVFGGAGADASALAEPEQVSEGEMTSGTLVADRTFPSDGEFDDQWVTVATLDPAQGEKIGNRIVFRLLVDAITGDDANVYDVAMSLDPDNNTPPDGLEIYSYSSTIRLPERGKTTELRFTIPADAEELIIGNFDAAFGAVFLTTKFASYPLSASGQNNWSQTKFAVDPELRGQQAAITLTGGREFPNDASFYVTDGDGKLIPFELPVRLLDFNARPNAFAEVFDTQWCKVVRFSGAQSNDAEEDSLEFLWKFGDGESSAGPTALHTYEKDGRYTARLEVVDSFDQIGNGSVATVDVFVKDPPVAKSDANKLVAVDEYTLFDGTASTAGDWTVARHEWEFGDGTVKVGPTVVHAFRNPGLYRVVHTIEDDSGHRCNTASEAFYVRVNARPVAEAGADQRVSIGQHAAFNGLDSRDSDGTVASYRWDFGDGSSAAGSKVVHAYAAPGTYTVTLNAVDDSDVANSIGTDTMTVIVNDPPVAAAGPDVSAAIGEPVTFDGSMSLDRDGAIIAHDWDFGDGGTGAGSSPTHAYLAPGTYEVRLKVTDDSTTDSATGLDTLAVRINDPPIADAGENQLVTSSLVTFDGTGSTDRDDSVSRYDWDFGDGAKGEGPTPTHVYARPGVFDVRLTVTDASGTIRNTSNDAMQVVVNERPIADAGPQLIGAPGETIVFDGSRSVDPDGAVAEYLWDFRDGTTGTGSRVGHSFSRPGTYSVSLRVKDNTGHEEAIDFAETLVVINESPIANAGGDLVAAPGDEVRLSAASSFDADGTIDKYRWDFSDLAYPVLGSEATRRFKAPGAYTAQLTVTDDSGTANSVSSDEVRIFINHRPVADAGPDIETNNVTVSFDAARSLDADGDPLTYSWTFGDGGSATGISVTHTYAEGGTYPVILTVDDGTGLANATHEDALSVRVNRSPVAVAGNNQRVCTDDVVVLDGGQSTDPEGGVLEYHWDFGDGTGSDIVNPTKVYRKGGVYPVTLSVRDDSGFEANTASSRLAVQVDQGPIADAGEDIIACARSEVRFDGSGSTDIDGVVNSYTWDFGDGQTGGGVRPAHFYSKPGEYRVFLTIEGEEAGLCDATSRDEVALKVVPGPSAIISGPDAVPVGVVAAFDGSASFMENGSISSWSWDFGDGTTVSGPTAQHTYEAAGVYRVTLTLTSEEALPQCRTIDSTHLIRVNAAPTAAAGEDQLVAVDEEVVFDASASSDTDGGIVAYEWEFGDGDAATGIEVRHRYRAPGTYVARLTVRDEAGLENSVSNDELVVEVNSRPEPSIDGPAVACVGESETWRAGGGADGASHAWVFGDGANSTGPSASHAYGKTGRYELVLYADDNKKLANSRAHATRTIHVNQPPIAVAGPDLLVCPGDTVRFDGSRSRDLDGRLVRHHWDFGDGSTQEGAVAEHIFKEAGTYRVHLRVTDDAGSACSIGEDGLTVVVNASPMADAGGDRTVWIGGANDAVLLDGSKSSDADGEALRFDWTIGDGSVALGERVRHTITEAGRIPVRLTVSDTSGLACGAGMDTITIDARFRD